MVLNRRKQGHEPHSLGPERYHRLKNKMPKTLQRVIPCYLDQICYNFDNWCLSTCPIPGWSKQALYCITDEETVTQRKHDHRWSDMPKATQLASDSEDTKPDLHPELLPQSHMLDSSQHTERVPSQPGWLMLYVALVTLCCFSFLFNGYFLLNIFFHSFFLCFIASGAHCGAWASR